MGKYFWRDVDNKVKDWKFKRYPESNNWWLFYLDDDLIATISNDSWRVGKGFSVFAMHPPFPGRVVHGFKSRHDAAHFALLWRDSQLGVKIWPLD